MAAEVYFADMRAKKGSNLLDKVERLFDRAGFAELIAPKDLVALKVHFGERGNTAYIRPTFVRRIVDKVKKKGGKPFLTDANTLYVGSRANAVDHLETAIENGFAYAVVGAPLIIADGLTGKDYIKVPISGKHFKEVKIGSVVYHADAIIGVTHFKGHEATGFGGTIKNIGMGLGSRSGKQMMHSDILPSINPEKCVACGKCIPWCPGEAIEIREKKAVIITDKCMGCGECTVTCPQQAIAINWKTEPDVIQEKMAEYALGVLQDKKNKAGFFSFVMNVTPDCDCFSWSDAPIVPDVGILASRDPVALDQACLDLVNDQIALTNSRLGNKNDYEDKFRCIHGIDGTLQLTHAEKLGLGSRRYELIKI
ncbi:DUF362 domain-containing protein [Calderihabitans maritimus]|uniref:Ferredoxin n=1 Tax=Calderihabitans maritimus TaxID=1246530 RepID=A0A1Z5HPR7_9FIRM|nr:DUF362 domain-containing protein [Calderihabitans maritimus]GAW91504.1 hypothetical protein PTH_2121 [Calderihabitans maritimus]